MRYQLRVVAPGRRWTPWPLQVAVGSHVAAEFEYDEGAGGFAASLRGIEPSDPLTIAFGRVPIPWPYHPHDSARFAARLECGASVSLTADGFAPACADWTLRIKLGARQDADGLRIRAFDANSRRTPIPAVVAYDRGELIATFEELHFPAVLDVQAAAETIVGVGALTIAADP